MDFETLQDKARDIFFRGDFKNRKIQINSKTKNEEVLELARFLDPEKNLSIKDILPTTRSLEESIAILRYDYRDRDYPKCLTCGKPVDIFSHPHGYPVEYIYNRYCSKECASNNPDVKEKNRRGVSKALKESYREKGDEIKAKRKKTLEKHYGEMPADTCSPFAIKDIREKAAKTVKERYGIENIFMLDAVKQKAKDSLYVRYKELQQEKGLDVDYDPERDMVIVHRGCPIHGDIELTTRQFNNRTQSDRIGKRPLCPICSPDREVLRSEAEDKVYEVLREIDSDTEILRNSRMLIGPKELDFILPEYKIAIEVNGLFWHSSLFKPKNYHVEKRKAVADKGYNLYTFWEDTIRDDIDKIKYILRAKMGFDERIYARKCVVRDVPVKEAKSFANEYHFQGHLNASTYIGLYYEDELVQLMSFGYPRFKRNREDKEKIVELYRLCSKGGITVVGGPSKLLTYYLKNLVPDTVQYIDSYCDTDISDGNIYKILGFRYISENIDLYFVDMTGGRDISERISRYKAMRMKDKRHVAKIYGSGIRLYRLEI